MGSCSSRTSSASFRSRKQRPSTLLFRRRSPVETELPERDWERVSERISQTMGMHFPPERRLELRRGFARAAAELGFAGVPELSEWLLTTPPDKKETQVLAKHLTVGETYFFREAKTL